MGPYDYNQPYPQMPQNMQPNMPFRTNKIFVTSLQDALARPVDFNTCMFYFNQNNNEVYEIMTDLNGYKNHRIGEVKLIEKVPPGYIPQDEYLKLQNQYSELQKQVDELIRSNKLEVKQDA